MTTRDSLLQQVQAVREEMGRMLDGMDYCLDWRPSDGEWSAREVLYHLVDTPPGGIHNAAQAVYRGEITELTLPPDTTDTSGDRQQADIAQVTAEMEAILSGLEGVVQNATDAELEEKAVLVHFPARNLTEVRNLGRIIEGSLDYHWRDHLGQLAALREGLGLV